MQPTENGRRALANAVRSALDKYGIGALRSPGIMLSCLSNTLDSDFTEAMIINQCCDRRLLAPYAALAEGHSTMQETLVKAASQMIREYGVAEDLAQHVAVGIAEGVADWLDIPRESAPNRVEPASPPPQVLEDEPATVVGTSMQLSANLSGPECLEGNLGGVAYKLDRRKVHVSPVKAVLQLYNGTGEPVDVTVTAQDQKPGQAPETCYGIPSGEQAVIAFEQRVVGIASIAVRGMGGADIPWFTWQKLTPGGSYMGFSKIRATNAANMRVHVGNVLVMDATGQNVIAHQRVDKSFETGEGVDVGFYSTEDKSLEVYVDGVRMQRNYAATGETYSKAAAVATALTFGFPVVTQPTSGGAASGNGGTTATETPASTQAIAPVADTTKNGGGVKGFLFTFGVTLLVVIAGLVLMFRLPPGDPDVLNNAFLVWIVAVVVTAVLSFRFGRSKWGA